MTHNPPLPESPDSAAAPVAPHPRSASVQSRRISRIAAFTPVPVRARRDGWTPVRQAEFIGWLAETRCVKTAAARVGMRRETAYRLRSKRGAGEFCAAWDAVMGVPGAPGSHGRRPKVSLDGLFQRIRYGLYRPVMRGGRYVGTIHKPDNAALRGALGHFDRVAGKAEARGDLGEGHIKEKGRSV